MRPRIGYPVRIRGVVYPSMAAAARAFGLSITPIQSALDSGRIDEIGIVFRKGGRPRAPCLYRGKAYPSVTDAARSCGVSKSAVSKANKRRAQL